MCIRDRQGGDEVIECRDVSFSYPASGLPDSEKQAEGALKHISCTIEDGSFVLLCGTSGCGKTTMTRLFNGLIPHYHEGTYTGSVYLDGKDTRDLSLFDISLKVGSVFQNPRSQFFNVDTTSELAFGPENHGMAEDIVRERVKRVAAQLKLEPLLDRSIFSLSGGEKPVSYTHLDVYKRQLSGYVGGAYWSAELVCRFRERR